MNEMDMHEPTDYYPVPLINSIWISLISLPYDNSNITDHNDAQPGVQIHYHIGS